MHENERAREHQIDDTSETDVERMHALEAEALLRDARIAELVHDVDVLTAAMQHRAVIEQAKGVIMHSMQCGADAAFAVLVAASQRENIKLRDVAARIVTSQDKGGDPIASDG